MKIFLPFLLFILCGPLAFGQLEFTGMNKILFVGGETVKGKHVVCGVRIAPIDKNNLDLEIDILIDWKKKHVIATTVKLDESSVTGNSYTLMQNHEQTPAYRYFNENGLEILIAKENWHDSSYTADGIKKERFFTLSVVQIILPEKNNYSVKKLPLLFEK